MHLLLDQLCSLERIYNELFLQGETPDWTVSPAIPEWSNDLTSGQYKSTERAHTRSSEYSSSINSATSSHLPGSTLCVADAIAEEGQIHRLSKWTPSTTARCPSYWSGCVTTIESSSSSDIVQPLPRHSVLQSLRGCTLERWASTRSSEYSSISSHPSKHTPCVQARIHRLSKWAPSITARCPSYCSESVTTIESSPCSDIVQPSRGCILKRWVQIWRQHWRKSREGQGEKSSLL